MVRNANRRHTRRIVTSLADCAGMRRTPGNEAPANRDFIKRHDPAAEPLIAGVMVYPNGQFIWPVPVRRHVRHMAILAGGSLGRQSGVSATALQ